MSATGTFMGEQALLVTLLLERGILKKEDVAEVQKAASQPNMSIEEALVQVEATTEEVIARTYADHLRLPLVGLDAPLALDKEMAAMIGERICRERRVVPLSHEHGVVEVAFANPTDLTAYEEIQLLTMAVIRPLVAPLTAVDEALGEAFGKRDMVREISSEAAPEATPATAQAEESVEEVVDLDRPVPKGRDSHVIRLVNHILASAVTSGASDIHLEVFENSIKVRFRVDGSLQELSPPPMAMYIPMISRLKVLAKMDIAERRIPQDGAIGLTVEGKRVRPASQHRAHGLRREDGHAYSDQGRHSAGPDETGFQPQAGRRLPDRGRQPPRTAARDRADG